MRTPETALVLYARPPRPGRVKTRLLPVFSPEEACEIHAAFTADMVEAAAGAVPAGTAVSIAWSEPPTGEEEAAIPRPVGVGVEIQSGGDLGERMAVTIQSKLRLGHRRVAILGSDVPTLPADHLVAAFAALSRSDVVLGPAEDGGYYLVGMSRLHLEIFRGIRWGTPEVLKVTRGRLRQAGARFEEIGSWYDVDTPEDLARLWKDLLRMKERQAAGIPARTLRTLARIVPGRIRS